MNTGEHLGPYRIERELGSGGMGKVYAATVERAAARLAPGTTVALKVVHPHLIESEGFFKRFLREAEVGQAVLHSNVVRTMDCDAVGGAHFIVMEYVEGQTLRALLDELARVPEELCRHIGREICKGLAAIHSAGVVHRDVKPENVLVTPDHQVKVMDLGVARLVDESMRLSKSGEFVGSIEYAAPEQFKNGKVDRCTDLHALGLVLYEISSGQHPYRADGFHQVMRRVCDESPRRLGELNPQLSPFFEEVVHTLLAKSRDQRFATAAELLAVLTDGEEGAWWRRRATAIRAATKRPLRRIRIPRETAVYGREDELQRLRAAFARAKSGDGSVVLIAGEAGIGKSRLVDELIGRLQADGEDLNFLFGSYPPGGAATIAGAFATAFREHLGQAGAAAYLAQTPSLAPAFDALLSGDATPTGHEALAKDTLQTCFVNVTRALAAERPTVLLIDDLHFAPAGGRALFTALAMAVPAYRILLIGTARPGVSKEWVSGVTRLDHTVQIELDRLGPKDLGDLLRDCFDSERLALELAGKIGMKTDGNPFFVFEIIRGLREGELIARSSDGTWASTHRIDEIEIPSSVLDLVNARVAELDEAERDLLDVAACWGFEFDPTHVADAVGVAALPAMKHFGLIERRHRLVRSVGRDYVFDHHQVKEALYDGLNERLREMYHAALASALERRTRAAEGDAAELGGALSLDLCEHFLNGGAGERALRYLPRAFAHLQSGYLAAEGAALVERALAVPGLLTGAARAARLLDLAYPNGPLDMLGRRERQLEAAEEAELLAAEAGDRASLVRAAQAIGSCHTRSARFAESVAAHRRAHEIAGSIGDDRARTIAETAIGMSLFHQGKDTEAREWMERALASSAALGDPRAEIGALGSLGHLLMQEGRVDEAHAHHLRRLTLAREIGLRRAEAGALSDLGTLELHRGRRSEARRCFEQALELCRTTGHRQFEANVLANLGTLDVEDGHFVDAWERFEAARELGVAIGHRLLLAVVADGLGAASLGLGRLKDAQRCSAEYLAAVREIGDARREYDALTGSARLHAMLGDVEAADALARRALAIAKTVRVPDGGSGATLVLASHAADARRDAEADRLHADALAAIRASANAPSEARVLLTLAFAALDRCDAAGGSESRARIRDTFGLDVLSPSSRALLACLDALLPDADAAVRARAESVLDESGDRLPVSDRMLARFRLWQATRNGEHLEHANRLLEILIAGAPDECGPAMRSRVRLHRDILAARAGRDEGDADAEA